MQQKLNITVSENQMDVLSNYAKAQGISLEEVLQKMVCYFTENTIPYLNALDKQVESEAKKMAYKVFATAAL